MSDGLCLSLFCSLIAGILLCLAGHYVLGGLMTAGVAIYTNARLANL